MDTTTNPADADLIIDGQGVEEFSDIESIEHDDVDEQIDTDDDPEEGETKTEQVEFNGKVYDIPVELKSALMMQSDYTRKTQEVAEQRRALEAYQEQINQQAQTQQALLEDAARVVALNDQISQFSEVDWAALNNQDPIEAQRLWMTYSQMKDLRSEMIGQLQQKEQQRVFNMQQNYAKQVKEGHAILSRDIKGWSPELSIKLRDYAVENGFSLQDVERVTDTRVVKLLYRAYLGDQLISKQMSGVSKKQAQQVKPASSVGGNAVSVKDQARMSTEDWMKHRNAQISKQRKR